MPHYIAIHRFKSEDARKEYCMPPEKRNPPSTTQTKKQWGLSVNDLSETVKCRQQWVGDDIAFCHWEAPSQGELLELFNRVGPTDKLTIELHEQWRFVSFYNQTDEPIEHKEY